MKKYKLIKTYPFSPHLGYIKKEYTDICAKYPEFWEEIKEEKPRIYYWVNTDNWHTAITGVESMEIVRYKRFNSEKERDEFISINKPLYSKKQVINILKGFDRDINCFDERFDYNLYIERYKDEK